LGADPSRNNNQPIYGINAGFTDHKMPAMPSSARDANNLIRGIRPPEIEHSAPSGLRIRQIPVQAERIDGFLSALG